MSLPHRLIRCLPAVLLLSTAVTAQQRPALTAADYARAEKFMPYNTTPLVLHSGVRPTWLAEGDERFWYRTITEKGPEAFLIDAATARRSACDLPACRETGAGNAGSGGAAPRLECPVARRQARGIHP